jgi:hypothetical protein
MGLSYISDQNASFNLDPKLVAWLPEMPKGELHIHIEGLDTDFERYADEDLKKVVTANQFSSHFTFLTKGGDKRRKHNETRHQ